MQVSLFFISWWQQKNMQTYPHLARTWKGFSLTERLWITVGNSVAELWERKWAWSERIWENISSFLQFSPYAQTCKIPLNRKQGGCNCIYCKAALLWSGLSAVLLKYPWEPLHTCPYNDHEIQKQTRAVGTAGGIPNAGKHSLPTIKMWQNIMDRMSLSDAAN